MEHHVPGGLTEWGLRRAVEKEGYPVTHKQFRAFEVWGLIPKPDDGRYPQDAVRLLVEIVRHDRVARSLPRRVLLLRQNFFDFPVPPATILQAMLDVLPSIQAPMHKMNRVHRSLGWWSEHSPPFPPGITRPKPPRPPWREIWASLLESVNLEQFGERISFIYFIATNALTNAIEGTPYQLADIPLEELVILLTVHELAEQQAEREKYRTAHAPEIPTVGDVTDETIR